jgi:hypothetical protein
MKDTYKKYTELTLKKPEYRTITRGEAIALIDTACVSISEKSGGIVSRDGLENELVDFIQKGYPQLEYWVGNQPMTWLTEEERNCPEPVDEHEINPIYDGILLDPVKWAEWEFGIVCRYHQAALLRSKAKKRVLNISRRGGKSFCMVIFMLWFIYTRPNSEIILICPSSYQIETIFDRIRNDFFPNDKRGHWRRIPDGGIITRFRTAGHQLKLEIVSQNNTTSVINGYICSHNVRGKGKQDEESVLGSFAIVFDEFDYIEDEAAVKGIMAIFTEDPEKMNIMIASTPSGKRGLFWRYCNKPELGYELHRWSVWEANPKWSVEIAIVELLDKQWHTYVHEYEAEFGEEEFGWIRKQLLLEAFEGKHSYFIPNKGKQFEHSPIRTIGVDWDKSAHLGPCICIIEADPQIKKFRIIQTEMIPAKGGTEYMEEYTLINACKRIVQLNEELNPHAIYIDKGFGEMQGEILRKYGQDNPESGLTKKVRSISFSSRVNIYDEATGVKTTHQIKQVLMTQMRKWFEERRIIGSRHSITIRDQLENYRVEGVTQVGYRWNTEDEHYVDALALAIHAVNVEFKHLFNTIVPMQVATTDFSLDTIRSKNKPDKIGRNDDNALILTIPSKAINTHLNSGRYYPEGQQQPRGLNVNDSQMSRGKRFRRKVWDN